MSILQNKTWLKAKAVNVIVLSERELMISTTYIPFLLVRLCKFIIIGDVADIKLEKL
jgi:hypothetical protein